MPELPDVIAYIEALRPRIADRPIERVRVISPFFVRSVDPSLDDVVGHRVVELRRIGKRIVFALDDDLRIVIHLMIAGRLRWLKPNAKPPGRIALAVFDFPEGGLAITEAGTKKRASLHVVRGDAALVAHDRGGLDVLDATADAFGAALTRENHTLKRALTDPRLFSGIGNAYSDEILHAARLSPMKRIGTMSESETARLFEAARRVLTEWTQRLCASFIARFPGPGEVTAFRPEFAVHGKFGSPCPICQSKVQRIRYADNETNYCPKCQNAGRILADRSLSRLLKDDWPRAE
jgi:formamidopyrimidine-DNA glycosylase